MKKIIAISLLTGWLAATFAFGQGYFSFAAGKSQAWDGFTTAGVSTLATTVNTSFLWGPANTTPNVANVTGLASTPTNGPTSTPNYTSFQAWSAILDGQFTLAVNNNTSNVVTQLTSANGSWNYLNGFAFPVTGTAPGTTYTVYEISWSSQYATPALAAANAGFGSALGWSTPFQYTAVSSLGTPGSMIGSAAGFGTYFPLIPEPATMTLATLGGLSLLAFRRRNK